MINIFENCNNYYFSNFFTQKKNSVKENIVYSTKKIDNKNYNTNINIDSNISQKNEQKNYIYLINEKHNIHNILCPKVKFIDNKTNQINQINNIKKETEENKNKKKKNVKIKKEQNLKDVLKIDSKEKNEKINKNTIDSLSEVKKFKTELCHNWEVTGTCKYEQNVKHYLCDFFLYSVYLLMELMI